MADLLTRPVKPDGTPLVVAVVAEDILEGPDDQRSLEEIIWDEHRRAHFGRDIIWKNL